MSSAINTTSSDLVRSLAIFTLQRSRELEQNSRMFDAAVARTFFDQICKDFHLYDGDLYSLIGNESGLKFGERSE